MSAIALSELIQIFRNRLVLVTGLVMPAAVSAYFIYQRDTFADLFSLGYIAATVMFVVGAFGLYASMVTALASRRQNLFLKRLRSTAASDRGILAGLILPAVVLALVQLTVILTVLGAVAGAPSNLPLLAAAVLATMAMMIGLGLATAGLTNSPEHAQVTTLPVSLGVIAVAAWVGVSGTEDLTLLKRLLPGHRTGDERLERRGRRGRLAGPAGAHPGLGGGGRVAGRADVPLGAAALTTAAARCSSLTSRGVGFCKAGQQGVQFLQPTDVGFRP
jgi:ABC-2 type transport system permease protein